MTEPTLPKPTIDANEAIGMQVLPKYHPGYEWVWDAELVEWVVKAIPTAEWDENGVRIK